MSNTLDPALYRAYVDILREELIPAMGCTEPIALAYAAALARRELGVLPETAQVSVSANIIKNVKSVIVPHTGGLRGIPAAVAAGVVAGDAARELEVLAAITPDAQAEIERWRREARIDVRESDSDFLLDIDVALTGGGHTARVRLVGGHTNVVRVERDGAVLVDRPCTESAPAKGADRSLLDVEHIVRFADELDVEDVRQILQRQIDYNTAIAEEGLRGDYGANIGRILLQSYGDTVHNRAKAMAAAGSDARMNGCELPVVINSGSGNQGLTASLPVIVYARRMQQSPDRLFRALAVSNLVTIHIKTGIGKLSAFCGAVAAGVGAGAGVCYLHGGGYTEIAHTIVNAIAVDSGMICDGAKASCAAKIASAVEAGLLGMQMQMHDSQFFSGDGIVTKGVENNIRNVGALAREGMRETDRTIIRMMTQDC